MLKYERRCKKCGKSIGTIRYKKYCVTCKKEGHSVISKQNKKCIHCGNEIGYIKWKRVCNNCLNENRKKIRIESKLRKSIIREVEMNKEINKNNYSQLNFSLAMVVKKQYFSDYPKWKVDLIKIIINMLYYIDCFKECCIDGVPDDLKQKFKNINNKQLKINNVAKKTILSYKKYSTMPHYRCGHFRYLKSEMFSKKRFQTIYVKPTFVKAKTITNQGLLEIRKNEKNTM